METHLHSLCDFFFFTQDRSINKTFELPSLEGILTSSIWGSDFTGRQITSTLSTALLTSDVSGLVISQAGATRSNFKQTVPIAPTN